MQGINSIDRPKFRILDAELKGHDKGRYLCALFVHKFDSLSAVYEINSHADEATYGIKDLHIVGASFAKAIFDYLGFKVQEQK